MVAGPLLGILLGGGGANATITELKQGGLWIAIAYSAWGILCLIIANRYNDLIFLA